MSGLVVAGVHKSFGRQQVLRGVDLDVPAGHLTAILGPSGSGKTTLLRVVAGFERADAGSVTLGERVVDDGRVCLRPEHRRIGYVPQEGGLFPHLTVERNIAFGLGREARADGRVAELVDLVGLTGLVARYPHQLSGGEQQRVALARALAIRPALVLLDEPFSALDASLRTSMRDDVRRILRTAGATALLVTHDQDEALSMADLVAVIREGRIVQCAAPRDIYTRPVDAPLARFVGDANLLDGTLTGDTVATVFGDLPVAAPDRSIASGERVVVLVRPEQVEILSGGLEPGAVEPGAVVTGTPGTVAGWEYHGHDATLRVRLDGQPEPGVLARLAGDLVPPVGTPVVTRVRGGVIVWPGAARSDE